MDINRAKEIIEALAEGIDPTTGEVLPNDNVCNKGEVVRAFYSVLDTLNKKHKKGASENAGKPWTIEDEELLKKLYISNASQSEICKTLGRTANGIGARLVRLGLIENRGLFRDRD